MRERGSAPLELAVGVLTLLIPAALLVLSFGPWLERRTFVRLAASETARYLVLDGDEPGALAYLEAFASDNRIDPAAVSVGLCGPPAPLTEPAASSCAQAGRGGAVEVSVAVAVPAIITPFGTVGSVQAGYTHVEFVDLYRSMP